MRNHLISFLVAASFATTAHGFMVPHQVGLSSTRHQVRGPPPPSAPSMLTSSSQRFLSNQNDESSFQRKINDGSGRGAILLGIVMLLNVWLFSLPPSFRRQNVCTPEVYERLEQAGVQPGDERYCITMEMWKDSIADYYAKGGGVVFDLSIDPRTLERNKILWESTFGGN